MSQRAREVVALIDQALLTHQRNPTLFAAQVRAGERTGRDRTCLQLAAAAARLKRRQVPAKSRAERDEVERVDTQWEERHARDREEHHRAGRLHTVNERRAVRDQADDLNLHHAAITRAARMSTVRAGNIAATTRGGEAPAGAPTQQLLDDDPRIEALKARHHRLLLSWHDILDEYEGLGTKAIAVAQMDGVEKDRVILQDGEGLTVRQFIDEYGREYGSDTYIRELRKKHDRDRLGRPTTTPALDR